MTQKGSARGREDRAVSQLQHSEGVVAAGQWAGGALPAVASVPTVPNSLVEIDLAVLGRHTPRLRHCAEDRLSLGIPKMIKSVNRLDQLSMNI
jgi:hypothetical protein